MIFIFSNSLWLCKKSLLFSIGMQSHPQPSRLKGSGIFADYFIEGDLTLAAIYLYLTNFKKFSSVF